MHSKPFKILNVSMRSPIIFFFRANTVQNMRVSLRTTIYWLPSQLYPTLQQPRYFVHINQEQQWAKSTSLRNSTYDAWRGWTLAVDQHSHISLAYEILYPLEQQPTNSIPFPFISIIFGEAPCQKPFDSLNRSHQLQSRSQSHSSRVSRRFVRHDFLWVKLCWCSENRLLFSICFTILSLISDSSILHGTDVSDTDL